MNMRIMIPKNRDNSGTSSLYIVRTCSSAPNDEEVGQILVEWDPYTFSMLAEDGLVPNLIKFGGGIPIRNPKGQILGGIGVSGASKEDDAACAQAGLDAVKAMLK